MTNKTLRAIESKSIRINIVITMGNMHIRLRPIGNSQGIVIPKPILTQLGLADAAEAEMTVERNALVVRRIAPARRAGWAEAAKQIAAAGDDALVLGDFKNESDAEIVW